MTETSHPWTVYELVFPDNTWWVGAIRRERLKHRLQGLRCASVIISADRPLRRLLLMHRSDFRCNQVGRFETREDAVSFRERLIAAAAGDPLCSQKTMFRPGDVGTCNICGKTKCASRFNYAAGGRLVQRCISCKARTHAEWRCGLPS